MGTDSKGIERNSLGFFSNRMESAKQLKGTREKVGVVCRVVGGTFRKEWKAGEYSRWRRSTPDAFLRRGSLRRTTGLSTARARLRLSPNVLPLRPGPPPPTPPPPSRPVPRRRGAARGSAATRRGCLARYDPTRLGTARVGSCHPALAERVCSRYSQLPEKVWQNISLCIFRWYFFPPGLSSLYIPKHMASSLSASMSYSHRS